MPVTFGGEIVGLAVVDSHGDLLGSVKDLVIDLGTGAVVALLVQVETGIDIARLPWEEEGGLVRLAVEEVQRVGAQVHLER
uniref:PRC-barrel domain-containing protein n=1 Tax=uncultured marine group II/III euryarchaeote KM3_109_G01 TaxID=1457850 RepID=A0A075GCH2_9EURY|nr:hypothetical protein [uncultured marine group II/III euryarchaeote KM3_109_G01]